MCVCDPKEGWDIIPQISNSLAPNLYCVVQTSSDHTFPLKILIYGDMVILIIIIVGVSPLSYPLGSLFEK